MKGVYKYLGFDDRKKIETLWNDSGATAREIAENLGIHISTVYEELKRGETGKVTKDFRQEYSAELSQQKVQAAFKRRGQKKKGVERNPAHREIAVLEDETVCGWLQGGRR